MYRLVDYLNKTILPSLLRNKVAFLYALSVAFAIFRLVR